MRTPIRGLFFYLYIVIDVWSRKIVAAAVHTSEGSAEAAKLLRSAYAVEGVRPKMLHLHSDNGSPMKGATLLGTLQSLGVVPSFSRPRVSDDNPYSEALFRTLKYRPEYPKGVFASIEAARSWVARFVTWYNEEHLHSGIRFVTPGQRHRGDDLELLAKRREVYEAARKRNPERWAGTTRNWTRENAVTLNPERERIAS